MKKIIAFAAVAAACSTSAFAQVSNFTGLSAAVNLDAIGNSVEINNVAGSDAGSVYSPGANEFGANAQVAYGFELSPKSVVSLGASYSLTGYDGFKSTDSIADGSGKTSTKATNVMSLYVEPGYLVSNSTLAYGKVGYEATSFEGKFKDGSSASLDLTGVSYGFGIRTMIDKNLFVQAEVKRIDDNTNAFAGDTESNFKAKVTAGSIGLGYKF